VVERQTAEEFKRELDWLAKEKEQISLLKSYLTGNKIKHDGMSKKGLSNFF
jgi:hypothetical protein